MVSEASRDELRRVRTVLFVPGDRPDRFDKATASGADSILIDLEDAVQPERRPEARVAVVDWVEQLTDRPQRPLVLVRVNSHDSEDLALDLEALSGLELDGVVAPKFSATAVDTWSGFSAYPVVAIVETAEGFRDIASIRSTPSCVARLGFGAVDLAADLGLAWSATNPVLHVARCDLVLASRALGLAAPIDTAFTDLADVDGFQQDCRTASLMGYGAKFLIHPNQVALAASELDPDTDELQWASRVVEAWEAESSHGRGAFSLDGRMIDEAVVKRARSLLRS